MFNFFKKNTTPTNPTYTWEVHVELIDISVNIFLIGSASPIVKLFTADAFYYPSISNRMDGLIVTDADTQLINFMSRWKQNGVEVFNDSVIRFDEFNNATITKTIRHATIIAHSRSCRHNIDCGLFFNHI